MINLYLGSIYLASAHAIFPPSTEAFPSKKNILWDFLIILASNLTTVPTRMGQEYLIDNLPVRAEIPFFKRQWVIAESKRVAMIPP